MLGFRMSCFGSIPKPQNGLVIILWHPVGTFGEHKALTKQLVW